MNPKLNNIMLIDDSEADNFIHQRILRKADVSHNIIVKKSGQDALDFLISEGADGSKPAPELIFLDINMPGMNGWEFLEHYRNLQREEKAGIIVCLLTTSVAEADKERAKGQPQIKSYLHKPLTEAVINSILNEYFPGDALTGN
jgi:CheY-like chemotaxis protein